MSAPTPTNEPTIEELIQNLGTVQNKSGLIQSMVSTYGSTFEEIGQFLSYFNLMLDNINVSLDDITNNQDNMRTLINQATEAQNTNLLNPITTLENENSANISNMKTNINDMQTKLYQLLDKSGATVPQNPPNNTGEPPQPLSSGTVAYPNTNTPNLMQGGKKRKKTKKKKSIKKSKKKRKISRKH